jgi:hypothetical protein
MCHCQTRYSHQLLSRWDTIEPDIYVSTELEESGRRMRMYRSRVCGGDPGLDSCRQLRRLSAVAAEVPVPIVGLKIILFVPVPCLVYMHASTPGQTLFSLCPFNGLHWYPDIRTEAGTSNQQTRYPVRDLSSVDDFFGTTGPHICL